MLRTFCKSKIMGAVVFGKQIHYSGSIGIDKKIMEAADILPGEQVQVLNADNGERLTTYAIEEEAGSGKIMLYGPAARRGEPGDRLVILSYCLMETHESKNHPLHLIKLGAKNRVTKKK